MARLANIANVNPWLFGMAIKTNQTQTVLGLADVVTKSK
jgi:hypothetical protein